MFPSARQLLFQSERNKQDNQHHHSFHLHASVAEVIQELRELGGDPSKMPDLHEKVHSAVLKDFPLYALFPTAENMDDSIVRDPKRDEAGNRKRRFEPGQWCEFLGLDMKWHLAPVKQVIKVAPEEWKPRVDRKPDWDLYYSFLGIDLVPKQRVRAPEEGLKRRFGLRPWVWQQWAFLKVESMVRFQRFHERDYETLNFGLTANLFFIQWLDDDRNADFKLFYESRPQHETDKLVHHLLSPFVLMDQISKDPKGEWDFAQEDNNISLYQYVSLLGAGWVTCLGAMLVQCSIPVLLLYESMANSDRFDVVNSTDNSWDRFCKANSEYSDFDAGLVINVVILILYVLRNLPQVIVAYFDTMGEADTVNSKVESLRTLVYYRGEASLGMCIGYRIERFMNSTYMAMVNTMMLFTLFLTDEPSEIILNALAIEFVVTFAEDVVRLRWIDPYFRYIRAAATEMVMRYYVECDLLRVPEAFCKEYDIPLEFYEMQLTNGGLADAELAQRDSHDAKYLLPKDQVWEQAKLVASKNGNVVARRLFEKQPAKFDYVSRVLGLSERGIFSRYAEFRTWSRWDKLLFASPCGETYLPPNLPSTKPQQDDEFLNEESEPNSDAYSRFFWQTISTILFVRLAQSLTRTYSRRVSWVRFFGAIVDGLIEWFSMAYLIVFPFTFAMFLALQVGCY